MKVLGLKETNLDACVSDAQQERVVITRDGKPVALIVGVKGLDAEQLELGSSDKFWGLIMHRRQQRPVTRRQVEEGICNSDRRQPEAAQHGAADRRAARTDATKPKRGSRATRG